MNTDRTPPTAVTRNAYDAFLNSMFRPQAEMQAEQAAKRQSWERREAMLERIDALIASVLTRLEDASVMTDTDPLLLELTSYAGIRHVLANGR